MTGHPAQATQAAWLSAQEYGRVYLVTDPGASPFEQKAVAEFQKYWKLSTGQDVSPGPAGDDGIAIHIGRASLPEIYTRQIDWPALQLDGVYLRSYGRTGEPGRALVLAGGSRAGTLYAVYEFFERYLGVRWLTPAAIHLPPAPAFVPEVRYEYTPPFVHRVTQVMAGGDPDPYRVGTPFIHGLRGHTGYVLLPPKDYFKDHPEYFSEINGQRLAPVNFDWRNRAEQQAHAGELGQLCMSNPATAKALAEALCARIAANKTPGANIWSVCQMDWSNNCQCPECKAIDEREGTPMGSLLTGINRVAELVEQQHPGHYLHTFAYTYSRMAPKTIKPHPNVVVQLCSFECDYFKPLADPGSPSNQAFMRDYQAWAKLTKNLILYDYPINYGCYLLPFPNLHVLGPNYATIAQAQSLGIFSLNHNGGETHEFGHLKTYLIAKLLWNPQADQVALRNEFIDLYYGQGAPFIKEYIALLTQAFRAKGLELGIGDLGSWLDAKVVAEADTLFQGALAAAESPTMRRRIDAEYMQVQMAALAARPTLAFNADQVTFTRPPSLTAEAMLERMRSHGCIDFGEHRPLDYIRHEYGGPAFARSRTTPLITLENERFLILITPELAGSVLRWQDKRTGHELLRGYETYGAYSGTWQDWIDRNALNEAPVAAKYVVVEKGPHRAVLEAKAENGAVVRREMTVAPGSNRLELVLTVTNPTDKPLRAKVKVHPEFFAQKINCIPEIWLDVDGKWQRRNAAAKYHQPLAMGFEKPGAAQRWAFHIPEAGLTLLNEFDPKQIDRLLWFYNTTVIGQQVNLELLPRGKDLQPGESRTIRAQYSVTTEKPEHL